MASVVPAAFEPDFGDVVPEVVPVTGMPLGATPTGTGVGVAAVELPLADLPLSADIWAMAAKGQAAAAKTERNFLFIVKGIAAATAGEFQE